MQAFPCPFRFLDLPLELRMLTYKAVFTESVLHIRRHQYRRHYTQLRPTVDCSEFASALTKTCRQIRHESGGLLAQQTRLYVGEGLLGQIPRLISPEVRQNLEHLYLSALPVPSSNHLVLAGMESLKTMSL